MVIIRLLPFGFVLLGSISILNCVSSKDTSDDDDPTVPVTANSKTNFCDQIIPGAAKIAHGVDITKLDLFPTDNQIDNGFRKVFVDFTCANKRQWTHTQIKGVTFSWPDQFSAVDSTAAGSLKKSKLFTNDLQNYKRSILATLGFDSNYPIYGSLSDGASYKRVQEILVVDKKSIAELSATVSSVIVEFRSPNGINLHPDFAYYFKDPNPPKYEQSPERYDEFVQNYGTHYFESAIFGGGLRLKTVIEQSYAQHKSSKDISANMKASFKSFFGVSVSGNDEPDDHTEFLKNSQTEDSFYGGNGKTQPGYLQRSTFGTYKPAIHQSTKPYLKAGGNKFFDDWFPTINAEPWLLAGRMKPIVDLISNVNFAKELEKAIKVHRLKAYIADVKRTVELGKIKLNEHRRKWIESFENAVSKRDLTEFDKILTILDVIFVSFQSGDDFLAKEFQENVIDGILKLQLQLAEQCTLADRVKQLRVPLQDCIKLYEDYQKGKDNVDKRRNFIQQVERIVAAFSEHMEGVCDHLLSLAPVLFPWKKCTKCVLDKYHAIGITKYPSLDRTVEHPRGPG